MTVSVGRIVHYTLSAYVAEKINKRRQDAIKSRIADLEEGSQIHYGNTAVEGDVLPMIVVRVWENNLVNGQVLLDGNDTYWATSVPQVDPDQSPVGHWDWPARV
jgi:hypothetical protein